MDDFAGFQPEGFVGQRLFRLPARVLERMAARPFTRDFVVTDLGFFPPSPRHRVERVEPLRRHVLIYVDEGSGWVEVGGRRLAVTKGQVLLLPAGVPHCYGSTATEPWSIYWFHFGGAGSEELLEWTGFRQGRHVVGCRSIQGMRRQFRTIIGLVERGYHEHTLLELSRALINVLALLHTPAAHPRHSRAAERIEAAMDAMREDVAAPGPLSHYARAAGLSVTQFSAVFRQHTGVSPMTFFVEVRMQRACHYLDTTSLSIKEVAAALGFDDPLYFSRAFKRCTGLAPTEYRGREGG